MLEACAVDHLIIEIGRGGADGIDITMQVLRADLALLKARIGQNIRVVVPFYTAAGLVCACPSKRCRLDRRPLLLFPR